MTHSWHKPKKTWHELPMKSKYECNPPTTSWSAPNRWSRFLSNCWPRVKRRGEFPLQQLQQGTYLRSQADAAVAQEFEARTLLLQSELEYAQAQDELTNAIGQAAK